MNEACAARWIRWDPGTQVCFGCGCEHALEFATDRPVSSEIRRRPGLCAGRVHEAQASSKVSARRFSEMRPRPSVRPHWETTVYTVYTMARSDTQSAVLTLR